MTTSGSPDVTERICSVMFWAWYPQVCQIFMKKVFTAIPVRATKSLISGLRFPLHLSKSFEL